MYFFPDSMYMSDFHTRLGQVFAFDRIRLGKIIEIFQYSIIFSILAVFGAYYTNKYMLFSMNENDSFLKLLFLFSMELSVLTIIVFYLRKITMLVPSLASALFKEFIPGTTLEMSLWMILVFVYVGSIDKLNNKVALLKEKTAKFLHDEYK